MKQLAWAVMFLTAAVSGRADAECGIPHWFGAADGSALPARGSIYVHHEMMRFGDASDAPPQPLIRWIGASSTVSVEKVSDVVIRIDYDAPHAFGAELQTDPEDYYESTHVTFDPRWTAPATAPRVISYWHDKTSWTCSSSDVLRIQVDQPTAAFRLRWTFAGETREWIEAGRTSDDATLLELGKIDCGSKTVDPEELAAGGHLEVIAIRSDRSEITVTGLPSRISTADMPTMQGFHGLAMMQTPADLIESHPLSSVGPAESPTRTLGIIVLGILALGGLLAIRYRVRAPSSLPPTT